MDSQPENRLKVLVVDDEPLARDRLGRLLADSEIAEQVGEASNGEQALAETERLRPDLVLLDIRMPGMDGLEAARAIGQLSSPPAIVFTTAFAEHALEAFGAAASGYLLKPIRAEQLHQALVRASQPNQAQLAQLADEDGDADLHISVRHRGNLLRIPVDDVLYFQAEQKYVTLRHRKGEALLETPLKELEARFGERFLRIHRNALVARRWIEALEKDAQGTLRVRVQGCDETLEVSRRHQSEVRRWFQGKA